MDKSFFRRLLKHLRSVSPWIFLIIAVISTLVCITSLRHNNLTALQLRDEVLQVDKDNGDVETALRKLRAYIYAHMNTDLASGPNAIKPPIQLKYRYERLVAEQKQKAGTQTADQLYTEAQAYCEKQVPTGLSGRGRVPCISDYVASHSAQPTVATIPDSLYKFDFVSPLWSPDVAGWSLIVAGLGYGLFVIRFGLEYWVKAELRDL
jgi:hypothetical protein